MGLDRVYSTWGTCQVTRLCCTPRALDHAGRSSCDRCRAFRRRQRIVWVTDRTREDAERIALGWQEHKAKAVPMKEADASSAKKGAGRKSARRARPPC